MNKLILTAGLCLTIASLAASSKLMCYYTYWSQYRVGDGKFTVSDIDPNLCTHLIYAFSAIDNANQLVPLEWNHNYMAFNQLKEMNTNLKTLLSVGGWNFGTEIFSRMASQAASRKTFIDSSISLLRQFGFDGINLDWEYPGGGYNAQQDKTSFTLLCQELRDAFEAEGKTTGRPRLLVTAAVSASKYMIDISYEIPEIAKSLDCINVMTFDLYGTWNSVTGHHSPLYELDSRNPTYLTIDYAMRYWRDQGVPAEKLIMGFPAYGRTFTLSTRSDVVGAPISGPGKEGPYTREAGSWSYYEVCLNLEGERIRWIKNQQVPYGSTGNQWVGFDNKDSIDSKVKYIKDNNFGGVFVWSMELDDFKGQFCKQGNYPLISHLHNLLLSDQPSPATTTAIVTSTTSAADTTTTTTAGTGTTTIGTTTTTTTTAGTGTTTTGTTTTTTTTAGNSIQNFCQGKNNGLYINPNDPNSFINCYNNILYVQKCPTTLVFDDSCKCCNWP